MDRRQFGSLAAALFGARAVVEIAHSLEFDNATRLLLESARTNEWDRSPEFSNATWHVTQEMLDDCVVDVVDEMRARFAHSQFYGTGRAEPRGIMNQEDYRA